MILHIIPAEKFVDRAISLFEEAVPMQNVFYVFSQEKDAKDLNFVKTPGSKQIIKVPFETEWWKKGFIDFSRYKHVFFHNLYSIQNLFFANKITSKIIIHSIIWGSDFYDYKQFWPQQNHGQQTTLLIKSLNKSVTGFETQKNTEAKEILYYCVHKALKVISEKGYIGYYLTIKNRRKVFKKSDYYHTHVKTDFRNIKDAFNIKPKWSNFSYYTFEDYETENKNLVSNKILIGNSAFTSNNHLEAFEILKSKTEPFSIICPLNYGNEEYANRIKQIGNDLFQNKFKALTNFLPLKKYNKLQAECSIVIMNHYRQQAAGNIIAAFLLGSKVFMSEQSPLYKHFKNLNLHVFNVEKDLNKQNALKELSQKNKTENREIIKTYYSRETIIKYIQNSLL